MTSRIATVQPQRDNAFVGALAQKKPKVYENYQKRLDLRSDEYDLRFHKRVIREYMDYLCGLLRQVGVALLPECCVPVGGCYKSVRERLSVTCEYAEPLWLEKTAPIAREFEMLIASCYYRKEGDWLYNDAVLMDEKGEVIGIYHKVHLPCPLGWEVNEAELFTAGNEHSVFETKVGKVGFQICYDIDFPEGCRCLALNGADIILHPTVGYAFPDEEETVAEARLRTRATDNSVTVVYSNVGPSPGRSAIYAPNGNQIACCGRGSDKFVSADLDLRAPRIQNWGGEGCHDHRDQLARKRRPDTYWPLVKSRPPYLKDAKGADGRLYEYVAEVGLE